MKRLIACLLIVGFFAGCSSSTSLGTAADRLDSSAHSFYQNVDATPTPGHTVTDAAMLAQATRDFSREVDRNRSQEYLRPSFDRVAERYHHLRRQLDDREYYDRYGNAGFDRVTDAYLDVDRALNHPDSRSHD